MKPFNFNNLLNVPTIFKIIFLFVLIFLFPFIVNAQSIFSQNSDSTGDKYFMAPRPATTILQSNITHTESGYREDQCIRTGQWIGAISGSAMGLACIYWRATGVSGVHGPFWKSLVTGIPSAIIGSYVGAKTTKWITMRIMKGNPKPGRAALKGAAYGAIDGAIILTASMAPLLIIGHYTDTIHFNLSDDLIILKLLGASAMGGTLYGGMFGATVGAVYGPCISLYMKF